MAIPRCRVLLTEHDTRFRQTLSGLMDDLPDDLFELGLDADVDAPPHDPEMAWLAAEIQAELADGDELESD